MLKKFKAWLYRVWACNCKIDPCVSTFKFWDIIHWEYADGMAAKEGYGIVIDNRSVGHYLHGWKNNTPIMGYSLWRDGNPRTDKEIYSKIRLSNKDWTKSWNIVKNPSHEILEQIRNSAYFSNKFGHLDNLNLVEILSHLKEYERQI